MVGAAKLWGDTQEDRVALLHVGLNRLEKWTYGSLSSVKANMKLCTWEQRPPCSVSVT